MDFLNRLINVETPDPEDARRRRLLNILLLGAGVASLAGLLVISLYEISGRDPGGEFGPIYFGVTIVIVGAIVLFAINRYWSRRLAGALFVGLLTLSIVFGDEPQEVVDGRTLFMFAVPIFVSSVIFRPYASFITAGFIAVILNILAYNNDMLVFPTIIAPLGMILIALVAWLATRSLEEALRSLRVVNEQLVAQSAELQASNTRLLEQAHILARTNAELQQFVQISTHDLREPLRKVRTYTELLEQRYAGQLDDNADKYIQYIVSGATRMQALITGLLVYLGVGGSKELAFRKTDLNETLETVLDDMAALIQENAAIVSHDPLPTVQADPDQISQLLQNLISNAIKFRREEPPVIHIGAERQENEWLFSIADNGMGIESEYVERIFTIFQRLNMQEDFPGTGIGLAIARKVVENHNGRIWAASNPSEGATFYFTLPV